MAPPPPSRHAPALMDELLEEIFIRLPIDDPAILFRAAAVCKSWRRLASGASLCRRLLEIHGSPPLRGLFCRVGGEPASRFVPAASSSSSLRRLSAGDVTPRWRPVDSLHGRVLIEDEDAPRLYDMRINLVLWNPTGGEVHRLPSAPVLTYQWNAALLYLDCGNGGGGHFQVVLAGTRPSDGATSVSVYSSEQQAWSKPVFSTYWFYGFQVKAGSHAIAIAGNAVYFLCDRNRMTQILEYDLGKQELSLISPPMPDNMAWEWHVALMRAEGDKLGFAMTQRSKVFVGWREAVGLDNGDDGWVLQRVIDLDNKMIPASDHWAPSSSAPYVSAIAQHVGVIFICTCEGLFSIDLKSGLVTKLLASSFVVRDVVPYVSFCTPASWSRADIAGDQ